MNRRDFLKTILIACNIKIHVEKSAWTPAQPLPHSGMLPIEWKIAGESMIKQFVLSDKVILSYNDVLPNWNCSMWFGFEKAMCFDGRDLTQYEIDEINEYFEGKICPLTAKGR